MANAIYPKCKEAFLTGSISWTSDAIRVVLVDTASYTYSTAHQYLSDIPAPARVATSGDLTGKTATDGVADASDVTFTALSGATVEALVIYKNTGTASTSPLIAYIDTSGASPIAFTPNGGDLTVAWPSTGAKIFRLQ